MIRRAGSRVSDRRRRRTRTRTTTRMRRRKRGEQQALGARAQAQVVAWLLALLCRARLGQRRLPHDQQAWAFFHCREDRVVLFVVCWLGSGAMCGVESVGGRGRSSKWAALFSDRNGPVTGSRDWGPGSLGPRCKYPPALGALQIDTYIPTVGKYTHLGGSRALPWKCGVVLPRFLSLTPAPWSPWSS